MDSLMIALNRRN